MKLNFKIKLYVVIVLVGLALVSAPKALAADSSVGNMCGQLSNINSRIQNRLKNLDDIAGPQHPKDDLNQLEQASTQKLAQRRSDWDKLRAQHYNKLNQRAKTDTQHRAVESYKETIETAVNKRRSVVDEAIIAFRTALGGFVNDDQNQLNQLAQMYKTSVMAALQKAQAACDNGESVEAIRTDLGSDLKAARDQLQKSTNKIHDDLENSRKLREGTIQGAIEEFQKTAQTARQTLEQALGQ